MWLNQVGSNDQFLLVTSDYFMTGRSPGGLKMDFSSNLSKCQISKRQKFKIDLDFLLEPKFKVSNFRTISKFQTEKNFRTEESLSSFLKIDEASKLIGHFNGNSSSFQDIKRSLANFHPFSTLEFHNMTATRSINWLQS